MSFQVVPPQGTVHRLYLFIIDEVTNGIRDLFCDEGLDESQLNEFAHVWQLKLDASKAVDTSNSSTDSDCGESYVSGSSSHHHHQQPSSVHHHSSHSCESSSHNDSRSHHSSSSRNNQSKGLKANESNHHHSMVGNNNSSSGCSSSSNETKLFPSYMHKLRHQSQLHSQSPPPNTADYRIPTTALAKSEPIDYSTQRQQSTTASTKTLVQSKPERFVDPSMQGKCVQNIREHLQGTARTLLRPHTIANYPSLNAANLVSTTGSISFDHDAIRQALRSAQALPRSTENLAQYLTYSSALAAQNHSSSIQLTQQAQQSRKKTNPTQRIRPSTTAADGIPVNSLLSADGPVNTARSHQSQKVTSSATVSQLMATSRFQPDLSSEQIQRILQMTNRSMSSSGQSMDKHIVSRNHQQFNTMTSNVQNQSHQMLNVPASASVQLKRKQPPIPSFDASGRNDYEQEDDHRSSHINSEDIKPVSLLSTTHRRNLQTTAAIGIAAASNATLDECNVKNRALKAALGQRQPPYPPQFDGPNEDEETVDSDVSESGVTVPDPCVTSEDEEEDELEQFAAVITTPDASDTNESLAEDSDPLNSDDDVSEEDPVQLFDSDNIIVCQFDKINRSKARWKFLLKEGIMNICGKDHVFSRAQGEADW